MSPRVPQVLVIGSLLLISCGGSSFEASDQGDAASGNDGGAIDHPGQTPGQGDGSSASSDGSSIPGDGGQTLPPQACKQRKADDSGIFVEPLGSDSTTCGGKATACKTVAQGLSRAAAESKSNILLGAGRYEESVAVSRKIAIEGGWDVVAGWQPICTDLASKATVIQAPSTSNFTLKITDGDVKLSYLTVRSKDKAVPSESLFGVIAVGTATVVLLDRVDVSTSAAGDGDKGANGQVGMTGATGCAPANGAGAAAPGSEGAAAAAGKFADGAFTPGNGSTGLDGADGSAGGVTPPACSPCLSCAPQTNLSSCLSAPRAGETCGMAAKAGCGGGKGGAGKGGTGGGSSVALLVWGAKATVTEGTLAGGAGGKGGDGGDSGPGGKGAAGVAGSAGPTCASSCDFYDSIVPPCVDNTVVQGAAGKPGLPGGSGSNGGRGGGGAGGFSFGVLVGAGGAFQKGGATLSHGLEGKGGLPNGPPGVAADQQMQP